ncbi:MAG: 3-oxo-tetronate kinase [Alphaproteobacteria bacterium]
MALLLGCVGDDFTGSTDLANTLVKQGMSTVQLIGVPDASTPLPDTAAIVVALKSRTIAAKDAVAQSLAALDWLRGHGARQFFFKYCSTFDSTDEGNIGPVAEAMLARLGAAFTIACPAFPTTGRTIYQGHLFVNGVLLSDSPMRNHPLTPMTDADLVRVLGRQTKGKVGLVPATAVMAGEGAIRDGFARLEGDGRAFAVVDAITDAHLFDIGHACRDLALVTGGSGVAIGLPDNFRAAGLLASGTAAATPTVTGSEAVIAGSCSRATLGQIAHMQREYPAFRLDPFAVADGKDVAAEALAWAKDKTRPLFYSSDEPEAVRAAQDRHGRMEIGSALEAVQAKIARGLVAAGVRRLIVAGGETSGAVVEALGVKALRIGPEIDPGVPWCEALGEPALALALKSGNFGAEDFFAKAFAMLP